MGAGQGSQDAPIPGIKSSPSITIVYNEIMAARLTQHEADQMRTMPKRLSKKGRASFRMPPAGDSVAIDLESIDGRTAFILDVNRGGRIKLTRCSYQERYRVVDILARLDIDGPPHTNPTVPNPPLPALVLYNGARIPCPHFHFYVEGFDARWAVPAIDYGFSEYSDLVRALMQFMNHCGVQDWPTIQYPIN